MHEPAADPGLPPAAEGDGCLEILSDRLRASPGVVAIEANFRESTLLVRYEPALIAPEQLNALADEVGALFARRVTSCEHHPTPGACDECGLRIGSVPESERDLYHVTAERERVGLTRRAAPVGSAEVVRPFSTAKPWGAALSPAEEEERSKGRATLVLTAISLVGLLAGVALEHAHTGGAWQRAFYLGHHAAYFVSALAGGWFALRSSLRALARFRFDVNLLMILAAVGAASIGYVREAAVLMFLFSLSNTLEVYTMGRTRRALHALLKLRPARARVVRAPAGARTEGGTGCGPGREVEVAAEDVLVGEHVIVRPGEAVPVDGVVISGASLVDQSSLTGESVPVGKQEGDRIFAGTLNQQGAVEVRATRAAGNSTLARIVRLVKEAQEQKSRTEEAAEWAGRYYTLAVMIGAVLMLLVPLVQHREFHGALYRAMTLLVVASPCALVIATPATILSAIASAARNGVLFKGGRFIEALGRVRAVAFDKTGTLTHGRFEITDVEGLDDARAEDVLRWAAGAESRSQHPLAQAVVRAAAARGVEFVPASRLTSHLGKGLVADVGGEPVEVGTPELFATLGVEVPHRALERIRELDLAARTAMLVRRNGAWGVIAAADEVRPAAVATVAELRRRGVRSLVLLSGDAPRTVEAIALRTTVDRHYGALLPEDKVRVLGELEREHGAVAMVGDGVNDAPALARATVGIAMGGMGTDAAMESADVVLMGDDLSALPYAVGLARHARRVVIQNIAIASAVMLAFVTLVFFGHHLPFTLPAWMLSDRGDLGLPFAVSGHEGSTVVVILNGLRLLGERRGK
jgi:Cd2+/Zn2+-exporting ATPase